MFFYENIEIIEIFIISFDLSIDDLYFRSVIFDVFFFETGNRVILMIIKEVIKIDGRLLFLGDSEYTITKLMG